MSNKELAVQLMGDYLKGYYSHDDAKPIKPEELQISLIRFYEIIKSIPDD